MMKEIIGLIDCLEKSPMILRDFIGGIPEEKLKKTRTNGKWSIHEHACHLAQAEPMINLRFERFKKEYNPHFDPYLPGETVDDDHLISLNLQDQLDIYSKTRSKTIDLLKSLEDMIWDSPATHKQYDMYSARILLRHTLMHDHFHMYRIEELWLTKDDFL